MRGEFILRHRLLFAARQIFYCHIWPFISEKHGDARPELFGGLELLGHLRRCQREIDTVAMITKCLYVLRSALSPLLLRDDDVNFDGMIVSNGLVHRFTGASSFANQFTQYDISHRESKR